MELKFSVHCKLQKPVREVYQAVYQPDKLSGFFTTGGADAPLDAGTTVTWSFHDFPGAFPVKVIESVLNERIALQWENPDSGDVTLVIMRFEALDDEQTLLTIEESGWSANQQSLNNSYGNCMGWSQMLCCLKVYLEYGKNLRANMY